MPFYCSQVNIGTVGESLGKWSSWTSVCSAVLANQNLVCEPGFPPGVSSLKGVLMEEVYFAAGWASLYMLIRIYT